MRSVADVPRRIDALPAFVGFVDRALAGSSLDHERRQAVHFVLEELLTNMIKYAPQGAPDIGVEMDCGSGGVEVTLTDRDVDCFDPTRAPEARIGDPITDRQPGGLGIHLIRRLVESFHFEYVADRREGRTRFHVGPRTAGETDAHD